MHKPSLISSLLLRNLFRRTISTQPNYLLLQSPPPFRSPSSNFNFISPQPFSLRLFSYSTGFNTDDELTNKEDEYDAAGLLSTELSKIPDAESLPLPERLDVSFSHIKITDDLIRIVLDTSPDAGHTALHFLKWVQTRPGFQPTDEVYSYFVHYFGRRRDFKSTYDLLVDGRGVIGEKCLEALVDRLIRADRPTQVVKLFVRMGADYGFSRDMASLKLIISKLCERGYGNYAEKMVKGLATEFFPDQEICDMLIKGWSVAGKYDEAGRLAEEMSRGGFQIGVSAYNAMLDCVCKLCREKDPYRLQRESEIMLVEMERKGVPRNVETFNVLITNYCKIRKTSFAMSLFHKMEEWGCYPNEVTFLVLIKSLYMAARVGEGDEMIDRMKSAGFGNALDKKAYYAFLKALCGIERVDHAMSVFVKMKADGCGPGVETYDLLMRKMCAHGRIDNANALFKEARDSGIPVEPKEYKIDPWFLKKATVVKKKKKRETLSEKKARKRRRLRKLRLSFVRKPRKVQRSRFG